MNHFTLPAAGSRTEALQCYLHGYRPELQDEERLCEKESGVQKEKSQPRPFTTTTARTVTLLNPFSRTTSICPKLPVMPTAEGTTSPGSPRPLGYDDDEKQLILCEILPGLSYSGHALTRPGYNSKLVQPTSPEGYSQMVIIQDHHQIMPVAVIHLWLIKLFIYNVQLSGLRQRGSPAISSWGPKV